MNSIILQTFTSFNRAGQSIIMVTHDIKTAIRANRILYLKDGNKNIFLLLGRMQILICWSVKQVGFYRKNQS